MTAFVVICASGIAGLAVTYGLNLNYLQYVIIWNLSNLENKIISVERIEQYTHIPSEAPLVVDTYRPPLDWPQKGTIILENLQVTTFFILLTSMIYLVVCSYDKFLKQWDVNRFDMHHICPWFFVESHAHSLVDRR